MSHPSQNEHKYNSNNNTLTGFKKDNIVKFKLTYDVNSDKIEFLVVISPTYTTTDKFINISQIDVEHKLKHIRFIVEFELKVVDTDPNQDFYSFAFEKITSSTYQVEDIQNKKDIKNIVSMATENINNIFNNYWLPTNRNITFADVDSSKNTSTKKLQGLKDSQFKDIKSVIEKFVNEFDPNNTKQLYKLLNRHKNRLIGTDENQIQVKNQTNDEIFLRTIRYIMIKLNDKNVNNYDKEYYLTQLKGTIGMYYGNDTDAANNFNWQSIEFGDIENKSLFELYEKGKKDIEINNTTTLPQNLKQTIEKINKELNKINTELKKNKLQENIDYTIIKILEKLENKRIDEKDYTKLIAQLRVILVTSKDDKEFNTNIDKIEKLITTLLSNKGFDRKAYDNMVYKYKQREAEREKLKKDKIDTTLEKQTKDEDIGQVPTTNYNLPSSPTKEPFKSKIPTKPAFEQPDTNNNEDTTNKSSSNENTNNNSPRFSDGIDVIFNHNDTEINGTIYESYPVDNGTYKYTIDIRDSVPYGEESRVTDIPEADIMPFDFGIDSSKVSNEGGNKKDLKRHKKNTTIRNRKK